MLRSPAITFRCRGFCPRSSSISIYIGFTTPTRAFHGQSCRKCSRRVPRDSIVTFLQPRWTSYPARCLRLNSQKTGGRESPGVNQIGLRTQPTRSLQFHTIAPEIDCERVAERSWLSIHSASFALSGTEAPPARIFVSFVARAAVSSASLGVAGL